MLLSASTSPFNFFIFLFILIAHGAITAVQGNDDDHVTNIGAIIDVSSRIGKEEKIAMEIAVQDYNIGSRNKYKLVLNVSDSGGDPLRASSAAEFLIKEHRAEVIVGMETWHQTVLVTERATESQVPVLSFATAAITPTLTSLRWPYLLRMARNDSSQMQCLASIVSSYGWRKVIVIYEDDSYSTDSLVLTLLSSALSEVGSEVEHWSAFPPFSTLSDPETIIRKELGKLMSKQSRVFIIARASLPFAVHLFPLAKGWGLMGKDSVWITTDSLASLFDTVDSSVMQSMEGVIGITAHFSQTNPVLKGFMEKFRSNFRVTYPQENKFEPGMHAMRAYDSISIIMQAMNNSNYNGTSSALLQNLLASNFSGLSGEIQFNDGELSSSSVYEIVNVIGKSYFELKLWSSEFGFYDDESMGRMADDGGTRNVLGNRVYWPGRLDRSPKGWLMPNDANPMRIGVPGRTAFEKFVKINDGEDPTGFCIDIFTAAMKRLDYSFPYKFENFTGKYDDLVDKVYLKEFDAVVGDITILANRSNYVEFTQPYAESGLRLVVPVKSQERTWLFVKPFSKAMWLMTGAVFIYTMFVVWCLEHSSNPDFRGPWKNQISTTVWFTFSTLFFTHRERLQSNYTRVVIVIWLFVVFVVTSSYTASLTSMLTVQRLEPTVTDIDELRRSNSVVGCDGDSFVRKYLEEVLHFAPDKIINIKSEYDYPDALSRGRIKAAFLELPYEKVFLGKYCKSYKDTGPTYRFGGLGFVFPKGSPIARDISKAILNISEDGTVTKLEKFWFRPSPACSDSENNTDNGSLSVTNFWGLFLVTCIASTVMLLLYLVHLLKKFRRHATSNESFWHRIRRVLSQLPVNQFHIPQKPPIPVQALNGTAPNEQCLSMFNSPGHPEASPTSYIEMPETVFSHSESRARILSLASFPGRGRRVHCSDIDDSEWPRLPSSTEFR